MQVYEWNKEMKVRERLDYLRVEEIDKFQLLKASNKSLKNKREKELEILGSEQLIQEKLFDELKEVILRN